MSTIAIKRLKWALLIAVPLLLLAAMLPGIRARRAQAATQELVFECRDWNRVRVDVLRKLISQGADVNGRCLKDCPADLESIGFTPLQLCVRSGDYLIERDGSRRQLDTRPAMELLLRHGAKINARANDGATALIVAVNVGKPEMVKILIDKGADVNLRAEPIKIPKSPGKKLSSALDFVNYHLSPAFKTNSPGVFRPGNLESIKQMLVKAGAK